MLQVERAFVEIEIEEFEPTLTGETIELTATPSGALGPGRAGFGAET